MTPRTDRYDVIVIGGGPAGCTAGALLAERGHSVLLLERDAFPRFKIGESLMPGTYDTFERLGVLDRLNETAFPRKHSVQFYSGSGRASKPFYFSDNNDHESAVTWQVLRSDFDELMIAAAADKGAEVVHEASAHDVLFEDDRAVGVRAKFADGSIRELSAAVVVDASGQSALISRRLKIVSTEPTLRKASIYTHFVGARRDTSTRRRAKTPGSGSSLCRTTASASASSATSTISSRTATRTRRRSSTRNSTNARRSRRALTTPKRRSR